MKQEQEKGWSQRVWRNSIRENIQKLEPSKRRRTEGVEFLSSCCSPSLEIVSSPSLKQSSKKLPAVPENSPSYLILFQAQMHTFCEHFGYIISINYRCHHFHPTCHLHQKIGVKEISCRVMQLVYSRKLWRNAHCTGCITQGGSEESSVCNS